MPKKTKREKIMAAYRNKLRLLQQQSIKTDLPPVRITAKNEPVIPVLNKQAELSDEEKQINHYFLVDLKKSLVLIAIVITLEISLYFATIVK